MQSLTWEMRRLAFYAAVRQIVTGRHVYLSTGCLAEKHSYCQSSAGRQGKKRPGRSKFSDAPCICRCHRRFQRGESAIRGLRRRRKRQLCW